MKKSLLSLFSILILLSGCSKSSKERCISIFVPGIIDDSPIYKEFVDGAKQFIEINLKNQNVSYEIMEAGTNQSEWPSKITALAASGKYELIISSNPSLPEIIEPVTKQFVNQKFIILNATYEGNSNIYTANYNQKEQSYIAGYFAGLMTESGKLALIAAQEYPDMNNIILPYFTKGAKDSRTDSSVDFRIVGNWYDATKGAEITDAVIKNNVDVILPICGGASQGVINSAINSKKSIVWFDNDNFNRAPDTIIGCATLNPGKLVQKLLSLYFDNKIEWGKTEIVDMKDGYIGFIQDSPYYISAVPEDVRNKMSELISGIENSNVTIK